ncbi:MmyB family transcriptional regulator [Nonomuraea sediminis]|uniref:MmyB family transcriptional regulator n=1 Tax=Nonomuraea sediminis TaxID=2835864 RepID=UPI001BDCFE52|nr:hypothetical protein [Nonomuraea sediminis]
MQVGVGGDQVAADRGDVLLEDWPETARENVGMLHLHASHHPLAGDITLGFEAFTPAGDPDQTLGLYTVEPGSPSETALRRL